MSQSRTPTHTVPSGLGGSFDVRILRKIEPAHVRCEIVMARNPDWDGVEFTTQAEKLAPIGETR